MANGNGGKAWNVMQASIGLIVVGGLFCVIAAWMVIAVTVDVSKMDVGVTTILNSLTSVVTTLAVAVVSYYFGSSKSSADKEETQKQATKSAVDAASNAAATAADTAKTTAATLDKLVSGTGTGAPMTVPLHPPTDAQKPADK